MCLCSLEDVLLTQLSSDCYTPCKQFNDVFIFPLILTLNPRIGDEAMRFILTKTSLFVRSAATNYLQITGQLSLYVCAVLSCAVCV